MMTTTIGRIRRKLLTPRVSQTRLDVRGFEPASRVAQDTLETVGRSFLLGYGYAMEASRVEQAESRLARVPTRYRGFAFEGAAMAFSIRDAVRLGGGRRVERLLAGSGAAHVYVAHVGVGWAMARLPRVLWPSADRFDPLLRWLVLDGYGFHQAYFHTTRYVGQQTVDTVEGWPGGDAADYARRAVDQGIGRALWFVHGADPGRVVDSIERFVPERRLDLFSGIGLAAAYAGGVGERELQVLRARAGGHRPALAQGAAFGAEARVLGGLVTDGTSLASKVLCGMSPETAADLARTTRPAGEGAGDVPAYEVWRQSLANWFVTVGQQA